MAHILHHFTSYQSYRLVDLQFNTITDQVISSDQVLCSDCVCEPAYGESWEQLVEVIEKILAPNGSALLSVRLGKALEKSNEEKELSKERQ